MSIDFSSILDNFKNNARKWIAPDAPPAPIPMQQGQNVSDFPGYQPYQAPPPDVDTNALGSFFADAGNGLGNFFSQFMPQGDEPPASPVSSPIPQMPPTTGRNPVASPIATPAPSSLEEVIRKGYESYAGGNTPLATMSAQLAKAGQGLPDPRLPAALGIKETSGGLTTSPNRPNNALSVLAEQQDYPDLEANITGRVGDQRISFQELMTMPEFNGPYQTYLRSGDPADFFRSYTPDHDKFGKRNTNPTIAEQVAEYNRILADYFPQ